MPTDPTAAALEMAQEALRKIDDGLEPCDHPRIACSDIGCPGKTEPEVTLTAVILTAQAKALETLTEESGFWVTERLAIERYIAAYLKAAEELKS